MVHKKDSTYIRKINSLPYLYRDRLEGQYMIRGILSWSLHITIQPVQASMNTKKYHFTTVQNKNGISSIHLI